MSRDVLVVVKMEGAENFARVLGQQVGARVVVADGRRAALAALRAAEYGVVVVEEAMVEDNPVWSEQVWLQAGLAMPVTVNFALSGAARVTREVKAALTRRDAEHVLARRAVAVEMENDLKSSVTGLLLESQLALREPKIAAPLETKLRHMVAMATDLRQRLAAQGGRT